MADPKPLAWTQNLSSAYLHIFKLILGDACICYIFRSGIYDHCLWVEKPIFSRNSNYFALEWLGGQCTYQIQSFFESRGLQFLFGILTCRKKCCDESSVWLSDWRTNSANSFYFWKKTFLVIVIKGIGLDLSQQCSTIDEPFVIR